jgi:hypothetical protein
MIVDCHTRIWESPGQLGLPTTGELNARRHRGGSLPPGADSWPDASPDVHLAACDPVDQTLVMSFKSRYLGVEIPTTLVAHYVRRHPDKLIGVAGVDPTNLAEALDDLHAAHDVHGMKAVTVSPASQDFHPADSRAMQVFAEAAQLKMPVFVDQGVHFSAQSKMEFGRPVLLDEVARELQQLRIVVAHMGYPWVEECLVLMGKHRNVFADISSLLHRPWQAYNAILAAYQYGVIDKLLFGSDFPFSRAVSAIESLYRINQLVTGTNLPTVPRTQLTAIVERDALALLGIPGAAAPRPIVDAEAELLETHDA